MAGHYPCIIVAVLVIYTLAADAESTCNKNANVVLRHLREEKELPNSATKNPPQAVYNLNGKEKQNLCKEVARHLVGNEFKSLIGKSDLREPRIAKIYNAYTPRDVRIQGLGISKRMWWCWPMKYEKMDPPKSSVGQVEGFFVAGSQTKGDTVYVFRPKDANGDEVTPVAELNNWSPPWGRVLSSSSSSSEYNGGAANESDDEITYVRV